jgi:F-type H+-transporting ATPase subunit b
MKAWSRIGLALAFACISATLALTVAAAPPPVPSGPHGAAPPAHVSSQNVDHPGDHHDAAHEEEGPKPINWVDFGNKAQPPYVAGLLNFAILVFIYAYFGKKPVESALVARREVVAKQIEEAQRMKREAEDRSKQYAAKLGDLDQELVRTKTALAHAGAGEKERIVREAEEKATRMEKDAAFLLDQETRQAQLDLQRETVGLALREAEQILVAKLTPADQERMAEDFLATLVSPARSASGGAS